MGITNQFAPYAVKLHAKTAQSAAAVYVDGVIDQGINSGLMVRTEGPSDGGVYRTFGSLAAGAAAATFTTTDLKALLDAAGMTGMFIDMDGTHPGVVLYHQPYAVGGTRGTVARSWTFANGILVPRTITIGQTQATVSAEIVTFSSDGETTPVVLNKADLFPAIYPTTDVSWGVGKWMLNAVAINDMESVTIDTGITLDVRGRGTTWPTIVTIREINPTIRINGVLDVDLVDTIGEEGLTYVTDLVVGYARKRTEGATWLVDGTAQHVKFTLGKCYVTWTGIAGDPAGVSLEITPWHTVGASPKYPLTINTASAIT